MWAELQTMHDTYEQINQGIRPWTALGDFMNYFFAYAVDRRSDLVHDPIQQPLDVSPEMQKWAAFCAASVEHLCQLYAVPCPDWVHDPLYTLPDPHYEGLGAHKPHVQARLQQESPEPFKRRNIYCSSRIFANKYEVAAALQQRSA